VVRRSSFVVRERGAWWDANARRTIADARRPQFASGLPWDGPFLPVRRNYAASASALSVV
ncbi:MAG: hypothetical protein ACM3ZE_12840, partial [Myxococcales bacterium]